MTYLVMEKEGKDMKKFDDMSERELLQAYRGCMKLMETGAVSETDFDGIFRQAIDERSAERPGYGVIHATNELLVALSRRWFNEHCQADTTLTVGTILWYADEESGNIERGIVRIVNYREGELDSFGVDIPDGNKFKTFTGLAFGTKVFPSEAQAKEKILQKR